MNKKIEKILNENSRQSLAAEGIVYSKEKWEEIERVAKAGDPEKIREARKQGETKDREEIVRFITESYKEIWGEE